MAVSCFVLAALLMAGPAAASALPDRVCTELRTTRDALIEVGVRDDMVHGPVWAAANLAPDRLERIRRYLYSVEQVLFRCRSMPRVLSDGMDFAENMPDPKPFYERRTFPLPVRKPVTGLRQAVQ